MENGPQSLTPHSSIDILKGFCALGRRYFSSSFGSVISYSSENQLKLPIVL
jgi:hypothetical protein